MFVKYKKYILTGIAVLAVALFLVYGAKPREVTAIFVSGEEYFPSVLLSGEVVFQGTVQISSKISGVVTQSLVEKGKVVKKGDLLVQLDNAQAKIDRDKAAAAVEGTLAKLKEAETVSLGEAQAQRTRTELDLDKAKKEFERVSTLAESGIVSQAELEQAERNLKLAEDGLRQAQTKLESLQPQGAGISILEAELRQRRLDLADMELLLKDYTIRAPGSGKVLDIYVSQGELISQGSRVALLSEGEGLRVKIQPDQRYSYLVAPGNMAKVWDSSSPDVKWDAKITSLDPTGNADQGSLTAELELVSPGASGGYSSAIPRFYPGQIVNVQIFGEAQKNTIVLPDTFLVVQDGENGVWLSVDNKAVFTPVDMGLRTEAGVVIEKGLKQGNLVLAPEGLKEGQKVVPRKEGE